MGDIADLECEVSAWPEVSVHDHRFGGREFRFRTAEIGHVHRGGVLDIPFPRAFHDALLGDRLAEEHHWVPGSGWTTFHIANDKDCQHALWLMRLSYLRYVLKTASDPWERLDRESEELHLNHHYKSLLESFVPKSARQIRTQPISA